MPIGTSDGEHFDDAFHQAVSQYTPNDRVHDAFQDVKHAPYVDPKDVWGASRMAEQPTEGSQLSSRPQSSTYEYLKRQEKDMEVPRQGDSEITPSPNLRKVLNDPKIQEAISNPKIDRTHDVPYEAGASNKADDYTTHIDRRIPSSVNIEGADGVSVKTFDPAIPANIHEQVERAVMEHLIKHGIKDEKAYEIAHHEYAEPAEDMWYRQQGISIDKVNDWWSKQDKITEHESPKDPPPDLYTKPYPHNKVEGMKHEPKGIFAEWPSA